MLVLSRRENESIVFPKLGIRVQVSRVSGQVVKLGVEAPKSIQVLRDELLQPNTTESIDTSSSLNPSFASLASSSTTSVGKLRHALRNRLNKAMLQLQVLQASIEHGRIDDLDQSVQRVLDSFMELNNEIDASLPVCVSSPYRTATPETTPSESGSSMPQSSTTPRRMALIVDDNANEAKLLAQYLELNGFESQVVGNGRAAIDWLLRNERPTVVLMDMNMPGMDGQTAIRQIRMDEKLQRLRVFGVSGSEQREAGIEIGQAGVERWFTKPVDARKLVSELQQGV